MEVEGGRSTFLPCVQDLRGFYFFGPGKEDIRLVQNYLTYSHVLLNSHNLPQMRTPPIHRITHDDSLLGRQPEQGMIHRIALHGTQ